MSPCSETWDCDDMHGPPVSPIPPPLSPCGCTMIRFYLSVNSPLTSVPGGYYFANDSNGHPFVGDTTNYAMTQTPQSPWSITTAIPRTRGGGFGKWVSPPLVARPDVDGLTRLNPCLQEYLTQGYHDVTCPPGIAIGGFLQWYIYRPSTAGIIFTSADLTGGLADYSGTSGGNWGSTPGAFPGTTITTDFGLNWDVRIPLADGDVWVVECSAELDVSIPTDVNVTMTGGYMDLPACIMDPSIISG